MYHVKIYFHVTIRITPSNGSASARFELAAFQSHIKHAANFATLGLSAFINDYELYLFNTCNTKYGKLTKLIVRFRTILC